MGLFSKKEDDEQKGLNRNLPTPVFENPTIRILEGFREDSQASEPIVRLARHLREQFGVHKGDYVTLRKGDRAVRARVGVSSQSDGTDRIARLGRTTRDLLNVHIGDEIEIIPAETLILLIDTSGSMMEYISGIEKMNAAKNAVREFIRSKFLMGQGDRIGIVSFGERAMLIERCSMNYEHLENRIDALMPNGATAMFEGITMAIDNLGTGKKRLGDGWDPSAFGSTDSAAVGFSFEVIYVYAHHDREDGHNQSCTAGCREENCH